MKYCGSPPPNEGSGRGDTDRGGWPAHAACAREMCQQPTSAAPSCDLFPQTPQWLADSSLVCAKRSPAHSGPDAPGVGFVEDAPALGRIGLLVWIAKRVPTHRG